MDTWSEKQIALMTQCSTMLAKIERECWALGDVADSLDVAREALTRARMLLCQLSLAEPVN